MTEQYLPENINGQPSAVSYSTLAVDPAADPGNIFAPPAVDTAVVLFPPNTLPTPDAGTFAVNSDPNEGTSFQFLAPGLYEVTLSAASGGGDPSTNFQIGRTAAGPIVASEVDFNITTPGAGVVAIGDTAVPGAIMSATIRISDTDIQPVAGNPNPNAILKVVSAAGAAGGYVTATTTLSITRVSL
jgi:hypothetical protein